jgi:hypothetical protein
MALTDTHKARIRWIPPEQGGRSRPVAGGSEYATVARFEAIADRWPQEAWSVVLCVPLSAAGREEMIVDIRLLAPETAPQSLLASGSRFDLFEGRRRVAEGQVL